MINEKLRAVDGMGLKIFNANSASLLETLKMGCAGFSGVMANFHPEIYSWLCKNFEKEPEKAKKIQAFLGFASRRVPALSRQRQILSLPRGRAHGL